MSSFQKVERIIKEKQDLFTALEELDRTGKLPKLKYKERYNFTLDEDLMREFRLYCKRKNIKMSNKVEELIQKELKQKS